MSDSLKPTSNSRFAHWVLKIGNLKESIRFFEAVLGLRVLRHEEVCRVSQTQCYAFIDNLTSRIYFGNS